MLTSADLPARRWGLFVYDETPLAAGVVRYVGEPVAAVAAADLATARAAAALIEVDYEELTPVLSIEEALKDGAIPVHPEFDSYEKRPDLGFARVNEIRAPGVQRRRCRGGLGGLPLRRRGRLRGAVAIPCLSGAGLRHRRVRPRRQADRLVRPPVGLQGAGYALPRPGLADVEYSGRHAGNRRRLRRQVRRHGPASRRAPRPGDRPAGQADALPRRRFHDDAPAPSGNRPRPDRREGRRHAGRARPGDRLRRRRLCRGQPGGARLRPADGARTVQYPALPAARAGRLYQPAARRRLPAATATPR